MNCMTSFFQSGLLDTKYNENEQTIPHDGTRYQHMSCSNTNIKTKHCLVVFPEKGRYTTNLQLNLTPNPSGIDIFFGEKKNTWKQRIRESMGNLPTCQPPHLPMTYSLQATWRSTNQILHPAQISTSGKHHGSLLGSTIWPYLFFMIKRLGKHGGMICLLNKGTHFSIFVKKNTLPPSVDDFRPFFTPLENQHGT